MNDFIYYLSALCILAYVVKGLCLIIFVSTLLFVAVWMNLVLCDLSTHCSQRGWGGGARINIGHWLGVWSCWVNLCVKCLWFQHKQLTTLLQWMAFTLFCVLILPFCETIELYRNGIVVFQSMLLSEKAILRHMIWSLSWASES